MEITGVFDKVLGKVLGRILSMIFAAYFLYYAGMNLREFVEIIKAISLPYTAPSVIVLAFVITVIFISFKGIEAISRLAYMCFYIILAGFITIIILAYPYYSLDYLTPIAGKGVFETIKIGFVRCSAYDEILFLAFIANKVNGNKQFKKAGVISLLITGGVFVSGIMSAIMAFGYSNASENLSNLYLLCRIIYFGRFFQRIDAIFIFIWVISSVISVGLAFYLSLTTYMHCFNIKDRNPIIIPMAVLLFTVTMLPRDISEIIDLHMMILKQYSFLLLYGVPLLVLLIAAIAGKRGDNIEKTRC
jgi:Spore germination protein.